MIAKGKVLVTGGCGFLGSHVCELFKREEWNVLAYDNLTKFEYSRVPYFHVEDVRDYNLKLLESLGVPTIIADVLDPKMLAKAAARADLIVHCAAQPAMTVAVENPTLDARTNILGTLNVLEAAKHVGAAIANCSTIHVYGTGINDSLVEEEEQFTRREPVRESHPTLTGALTPLHASKHATEAYARAYVDTYKMKAASFRLTGIYGPRQFGGEDHGWVANFAIRTILGLPIRVFGTNKQVRDILYVKDAARAFLLWEKAGCPPGIYNLGGGERSLISLRECLRVISSITHRKQAIEICPSRKGDLYYFCGNLERAWRRFRWAPTTLPVDGLRELIDWIYRERNMFINGFKVNGGGK